MTGRHKIPLYGKREALFYGLAFNIAKFDRVALLGDPYT